MTRSDSPARLLYLGLDACSAAVVREMVAEGGLPTFAHLFETAAVLPTRAPRGLYVGAHWASFATGLSPDHHCYYCWRSFRPNSYVFENTSPDEIRGTPFWKILSDRGKRVAVLDVPHSKAVENLNGVQLVEWGCHDRHFGTHSWPESLVDELNERFGEHPVGCAEPPGTNPQFAPCDYRHRAGQSRNAGEAMSLWKEILVGQERKALVSFDLLDKGGWDLFLCVFGETHCTGHQFWHLHDQTHPRHDPVLVRDLGDALIRIYEKMDQAVGDHLSRIGAGATVLVNLSHGMGPHYDGSHLLDRVLYQVDLAQRNEDDRGWRSRLAEVVLDPFSSDLRSRLLGAAAPLIRRRATTKPPGRGDPEPGLRPGRKWFAIPNNEAVGAVRLNVAGRDPAGLIEPGAEYEEACAYLTRELMSLVNVDTGGRVVKEVIRSDTVYERKPDDPLPDLLIEWERSALIERVYSPTAGMIVAEYNHWRTGDHTDEGILFVKGPGVVPGERDEPVETVDIPATICEALGVDLVNVDGVPLGEMLRGRRAPSRRASPTVRTDSEAPRPDRLVDLARLRGTGARLGRELAATLDRLRFRRRSSSEIESRLRALETEIEAQKRQTVAATSRIDEQDGIIREHGRVLEDQGVHLQEQSRYLSEQGRRLQERIRRLEAIENELVTDDRLIAELDMRTRVATVTDWIARSTVEESMLISVIMATRNRSAYVTDAVESVMSQSYGRWELVIVDDGSTDLTPVVLSELAENDERIKLIRSEHSGLSASRNLGLGSASGELITYIDDDNKMHADWLRSVAWAFATYPETDLLYGARIIDHPERAGRRGVGALPWLHFVKFDRSRLEKQNVSDIGAVAHRSGLEGAVFDETLEAAEDWDFLLRLSEKYRPVELPVVALYYNTHLKDRLSTSSAMVESVKRVRRSLNP